MMQYRRPVVQRTRPTTPFTPPAQVIQRPRVPPPPPPSRPQVPPPPPPPPSTTTVLPIHGRPDSESEEDFDDDFDFSSQYSSDSSYDNSNSSPRSGPQPRKRPSKRHHSKSPPRSGPPTPKRSGRRLPSDSPLHTPSHSGPPTRKLSTKRTSITFSTPPSVPSSSVVVRNKSKGNARKVSPPNRQTDTRKTRTASSPSRGPRRNEKRKTRKD